MDKKDQKEPLSQKPEKEEERKVTEDGPKRRKTQDAVTEVASRRSNEQQQQRFADKEFVPSEVKLKVGLGAKRTKRPPKTLENFVCRPPIRASLRLSHGGGRSSHGEEGLGTCEATGGNQVDRPSQEKKEKDVGLAKPDTSVPSAPSPAPLPAPKKSAPAPDGPFTTPTKKTPPKLDSKADMKSDPSPEGCSHLKQLSTYRKHCLSGSNYQSSPTKDINSPTSTPSPLTPLQQNSSPRRDVDTFASDKQRQRRGSRAGKRTPLDTSKPEQAHAKAAYRLSESAETRTDKVHASSNDDLTEALNTSGCPHLYLEAHKQTICSQSQGIKDVESVSQKLSSALNDDDVGSRRELDESTFNATASYSCTENKTPIFTNQKSRNKNNLEGLSTLYPQSKPAYNSLELKTSSPTNVHSGCPTALPVVNRGVQEQNNCVDSEDPRDMGSVALNTAHGEVDGCRGFSGPYPNQEVTEEQNASSPCKCASSPLNPPSLAAIEVSLPSEVHTPPLERDSPSKKRKIQHPPSSKCGYPEQRSDEDSNTDLSSCTEKTTQQVPDPNKISFVHSPTSPQIKPRPVGRPPKSRQSQIETQNLMAQPRKRGRPKKTRLVASPCSTFESLKQQDPDTEPNVPNPVVRKRGRPKRSSSLLHQGSQPPRPESSGGNSKGKDKGGHYRKGNRVMIKKIIKKINKMGMKKRDQVLNQVLMGHKKCNNTEFPQEGRGIGVCGPTSSPRHSLSSLVSSFGGKLGPQINVSKRGTIYLGKRRGRKPKSQASSNTASEKPSCSTDTLKQQQPSYQSPAFLHPSSQISKAFGASLSPPVHGSLKNNPKVLHPQHQFPTPTSEFQENTTSLLSKSHHKLPLTSENVRGTDDHCSLNIDKRRLGGRKATSMGTVSGMTAEKIYSGKGHFNGRQGQSLVSSGTAEDPRRTRLAIPRLALVGQREKHKHKCHRRGHNCHGRDKLKKHKHKCKRKYLQLRTRRQDPSFLAELDDLIIRLSEIRIVHQITRPGFRGKGANESRKSVEDCSHHHVYRYLSRDLLPTMFQINFSGYYSPYSAVSCDALHCMRKENLKRKASFTPGEEMHKFGFPLYHPSYKAPYPSTSLGFGFYRGYPAASALYPSHHLPPSYVPTHSPYPILNPAKFLRKKHKLLRQDFTHGGARSLVMYPSMTSDLPCDWFHRHKHCKRQGEERREDCGISGAGDEVITPWQQKFREDGTRGKTHSENVTANSPFTAFTTVDRNMAKSTSRACLRPSSMSHVSRASVPGEQRQPWLWRMGPDSEICNVNPHQEAMEGDQEEGRSLGSDSSECSESEGSPLPPRKLPKTTTSRFSTNHASVVATNQKQGRDRMDGCTLGGPMGKNRREMSSSGSLCETDQTQTQDSRRGSLKFSDAEVPSQPDHQRSPALRLQAAQRRSISSAHHLHVSLPPSGEPDRSGRRSLKGQEGFKKPRSLDRSFGHSVGARSSPLDQNNSLFHPYFSYPVSDNASVGKGNLSHIEKVLRAKEIQRQTVTGGNLEKKRGPGRPRKHPLPSAAPPSPPSTAPPSPPPALTLARDRGRERKERRYDSLSGGIEAADQGQRKRGKKRRKGEGEKDGGQDEVEEAEEESAKGGGGGGRLNSSVCSALIGAASQCQVLPPAGDGQQEKSSTLPPTKTYQWAGLYSDVYKTDDPCGQRLERHCSETLEYDPAEHEYGLLPAPIHVGKYLRLKRIDFQLPYDVHWLCQHNQLRKKTSSQVPHKIKTSNVFECSRPLSQDKGNGSDSQPTDSRVAQDAINVGFPDRLPMGEGGDGGTVNQPEKANKRDISTDLLRAQEAACVSESFPSTLQMEPLCSSERSFVLNHRVFLVRNYERMRVRHDLLWRDGTREREKEKDRKEDKKSSSRDGVLSDITHIKSGKERGGRGGDEGEIKSLTQQTRHTHPHEDL